eukprot:scaffold155719_cov96-Cyclotella_meneghiniana.AAC.1
MPHWFVIPHMVEQLCGYVFATCTSFMMKDAKEGTADIPTVQGLVAHLVKGVYRSVGVMVSAQVTRMTCNQRSLRSSGFGFDFGFETQANYASDEQTTRKVYVLFHQGERVHISWLAGIVDFALSMCIRAASVREDSIPVSKIQSEGVIL